MSLQLRRLTRGLRLALSLAGLLAMVALPAGRAQAPASAATSVPLLLPGGLVFDAAGDLIFAEAGSHVVRMVTPSGAIQIVAGTGVQGFAGDGGPAIAAELDAPAAVAVDSRGNLFIADTHNHRIRRLDAAGVITTIAGTGTAGTSADGTLATAARLDLPVALATDAAGDVFFADARAHLVRRIDAATGFVQTVAGSGVQGFAGDGGPAVAAALDGPYGLAVDAAGGVFVADTHNQRVRRVDAISGVITTVAGSGLAGFAGDQGIAATARLTLPKGLVVDAQGNLFLVDSANQRIRRVDAVTGQITTIAGAGAQGFAGDGGPAVAALVNVPRAVTLSAAGLATLADSGNGRLRQVDAAGVIHTLAGLGAVAGENLTLAAPSVIRYGSGAVTATLQASPATGAVTLFEDLGAGLQPLGSAALSGNAAGFSASGLAAGSYRLRATYAGDQAHPPAESNVLSLTVAPVPVVADPVGVSRLYGQAIPPLIGTLSGVLAQDAAAVSLSLSSGAVLLSPPGSYGISGVLSGAAAGDYTLSVDPAAVTIAQAPAAATLTASGQTVLAHVRSTTAGTPTGIVTLLDGANLSSSVTLSVAGDATFATSGLSTGSHTLSAAYQGDVDFLPTTSAPVVVTIAPVSAVSFNLVATGQTSLTVPAGAATQFSFQVTPVNGPLSSPIELTASGLPRGAVATFNPGYLPPSGSPATFIMAVQTPRASLAQPFGPVWALLLPMGLLVLARRRRLAGLLTVCLLMTGCGNRIYVAPAGAGVSYNIVVTATATGTSGAVLVQSVTVVMTVD